MKKIILIFITLLIYYKFFYIKTIKNPNNYLVLVNKKNKLPKSYKPSDLETLNLNCSLKNVQLRKEAKLNFEKMCLDMEKLNLKIIAVSGYRSYKYQKNLYSKNLKTNKKQTKKSIAKQGHSEHQTGLALDIMGNNNKYTLFNKSKEFNWVINNAHKYGFILRYPKDKTHITGYKYEPWHYRYVGKEIATKINYLNITLEEYYKKNRI